MTTAPAPILVAWSGVLGSPAVTELAPGRVWELATAGGDRFVLKRLSTFRAPDPVRRFADEARILTHLLQRGVPVAVPVLSDDGRVCAPDQTGALYAVFPMLGHVPTSEYDPLLWYNAGAVIARMHRALASCPFGIDSWRVGPETFEAVWRTAQDRLPEDAVAALAARVEPRWDPMVRALSGPSQRIHGDVHGGNVLTAGHEITAIIDCDHLPLAPRTYDLGYFLAFSVRWWSDRDRPSRPVDDTLCLLAGYDTVSPLTPQERRDLPALALEVTLGLIDHFLREHDLVEESWVRAAHRIGDDFDALERLLTA